MAIKNHAMRPLSIGRTVDSSGRKDGLPKVPERVPGSTVAPNRGGQAQGREASGNRSEPTELEKRVLKGIIKEPASAGEISIREKLPVASVLAIVRMARARGLRVTCTPGKPTSKFQFHPPTKDTDEPPPNPEPAGRTGRVFELGNRKSPAITKKLLRGI